MTKISDKSRYPLKSNPTLDDYLVGTDASTGDTVNFEIEAITGEASTVADDNKYNEINYGKVVDNDIASSINSIITPITIEYDEIPVFTGLVYNGERTYYNAYTVEGKGKGIYGTGGDVTVLNSDLIPISSLLVSDEDLISRDPNAVITDLGDITGTSLVDTINNSVTPFIIDTGENRYFKYEDTSIEYIYGFSGDPDIYGLGQSQVLVSELFLVLDNSITYVITKTSDITNDGADSNSTYAEHDELGVVATSNDYDDLDNKPSIPSKTSDITNDGVDSTSTYAEHDELGTVATSNDYDDLDNKPSVPSKTSDITNDGADNTSTYVEHDELSELDNRILVKQASDFGVIDPTKEYFIDGVVDMGSTSIEVPIGGINIKGYDFNISKLISSDNSYTMFTSPVGGSGDILWQDLAFEVTGTSSQLLDVVGDTGFEAFEIQRINFNDCTSLGEIDGYRQGLESGTGRFGGTPELTLSGTWLGGYFIETSIVRSLTDGAYTLFKEGASFSMASRFRSNMNIDLPASASFLDFQSSNFINPSTVQLTEMIISRNGVFDSTDSNLTPNLSKGELVSNWSNNNGLPNTFEGGSIGVTTETTTTINTIGVFETLEASVWTSLDLQHFDNPSDGQLRHLGNAPREYKIIADLTIDSASNNVLTVRVRKYDDSAATTSTVLEQSRQVNSLVGGRDVAFFSININTELDQNDYVFLEVTNQTSTSDVTVEEDSYYIVEQR